MTTDDMELVRQYVAGHSESAFATLVSRHINLVYSAALRRVGHPQQAEDITQAVFILLAKKAASLGHKTILPGWLYRTAGYVSGHAIKQELRRQHREQEAYMQSNLNDAEADNLWLQIAPLLEEAMLRLGEADRDALVLRFFEGRSMQEVGSALGASEQATKMRVHRALEKLRTYFSRRGVNSTAETIAGQISVNSIQAAPVALATSVTAVALAKGAAAGGSTLTLAKGVLKIMTWTKAKTVTVIGLAAILTVGTTTMMVKLQNQHGRLPKPQPVASGQTEFPKASWHFAGYANPESGFMSCMWAVENDDSQALLASVSQAEQERLNQAHEIISAQDRAEYAKMTGYRIVDTQAVSEDKVILEVATSGQEQTARFLVERIDGEWKFAGNATK